jgi:hypothetical protein
MKNLFSFILVFTFFLIINRVSAQENKNLAELRRAQSLVQGNARYVISNWDKGSNFYSQLVFIYNEGAADMDAAIDFSINEFVSNIKNKKYKINIDSISAQFQIAVVSIDLFNSYVQMNDSVAKKRTNPMMSKACISKFIDPDVLISAITLTQGIIQGITASISSKNKAVIQDFKDKMNSYKLASWDSMEK